VKVLLSFAEVLSFPGCMDVPQLCKSVSLAMRKYFLIWEGEDVPQLFKNVPLLCGNVSELCANVPQL
jgi:hypothetical protein